MTTPPAPSRDQPQPEPVDDPLREPPAKDPRPQQPPAADPRPQQPPFDDPPPAREPDDDPEPEQIEDPPARRSARLRARAKPGQPEGDKIITA